MTINIFYIISQAHTHPTSILPPKVITLDMKSIHTTYCLHHVPGSLQYNSKSFAGHLGPSKTRSLFSSPPYLCHDPTAHSGPPSLKRPGLYLFFGQGERGECHTACGILVLRPGPERGPLAVHAQNPNHWMAREFSGPFPYKGRVKERAVPTFWNDFPSISTWATALCAIRSSSITTFSVKLS